MTFAASRIVLVGASNLAMSLPLAIDAARRAVGEALFFVACGHGRSYGVTSRVICRTLPGIAPSRLWGELERTAPGPTYALLTDIGNDIGYGFDPATILSWVDQCLDRLASAGAQVVITDLPVGGLERLPRWRFKMLRALLYPRHRVTQSQMIERVHAISDGLHQRAAGPDVRIIRPDPAWFGFDPIHIRRPFRPLAFEQFFKSWQGEGAPAQIVNTRPDHRAIRRLRPIDRRMLGRTVADRHTTTLHDGSMVHVF
ncbi:MAG: hypothetical protein GC162_10750 [Planctomycetes bacterium]|nr:hypothetical protein [Planctomycetota bacterium]